MKDIKWRILSVLICVFIALVCASCQEDVIKDDNHDKNIIVENPVENAAIPENAEGPYMVDRVVDGDTVIVYINGEKIRVRILCIDTPESVAPEDSGKENTKEGEIASNRAKELLEYCNVYLEYDEEKYDQYDRLLAYVYLEDGRMFEEIMVSEGLAKVVYYNPNGKYKDYLYKVQDEAKEKNAGFWGTGFYN